MAKNRHQGFQTGESAQRIDVALFESGGKTKSSAGEEQVILTGRGHLCQLPGRFQTDDGLELGV